MSELKIHIPEDHRSLLFELGLREEDLSLIDGRFVKYEFDPEKGVRLYDPYYRTSYNEYIDVDGWSAWSSEKDTFMSDITGPALELLREIESNNPKPDQKEIQTQLESRFKRSK